jgi:tetratricopeptide (TPR) repeat protein
MSFNGQLKEGRPLIEESIGLFKEAGNLPLLQDSISASALMAYYTGDYSLSLERASEGLRVSRSIDNQWGIQANKRYLAMAYIERGEYARALENFQTDTFEIRDIIMDLTQRTRIYIDFGITSLIADRLEEVGDKAFVTGPFFHKIFQATMIRAYVHKGDLVAAEQLWPQLELDVESEKPKPITQETTMAYIELLFARRQYQSVVALSEKLIDQCLESDFLARVGEMYLLQAKALLKLDPPRKTDARTSLQEGLRITREQDSKRILWNFLLALAELSPADEAAALRQEALEIVTLIAGKIEDQPLRESFLNLPQVRSLMAAEQVEL